MRTQRKRTEKRHILRSLFKLLTPTGQKFVKRYIFSPMLAVMFGLGSASVWGLGVTNTADLATFNPSYESEVFTPGTVIANKDCVVNLNTIIGNNTVFQSKNDDGTFTFTKGVEISSSRTAPFNFDFNTKFSGNGSLTVNNAQPITIQKNFDISEISETSEFEFTAKTTILDGGEIITSKTSSAIISNTFNSNGTEWNGNVTITSGNGDYTGIYTGTGDTFNSLLTIENGAKAELNNGNVTNNMTVTGEGSSAILDNSTVGGLLDVNGAIANVNEGSTVGSMTIQNAGTGTLDNSEVTNKLTVDNATGNVNNDSTVGSMTVRNAGTGNLNSGNVTNDMIVTGEGSSATLTDSEAGNMDVTDGAKADLYDESKVLETINVSGTGKGHTIENPLRSTVTLNSGSSAKEMNVTGGAEATLDKSEVTNNMIVTGEGSSATLKGNSTEGSTVGGNLYVKEKGKATLDKSTVGGLLDVNGANSSATLTDSKAGNMDVTDYATAKLENNSRVKGNLSVSGGEYELDADGNIVFDENGIAKLIGSKVTMATGSSASSLDVTDFGYAELDKASIDGKISIIHNASVTLKNGSTAQSAVITDISSIVLTGQNTNIKDITVSGYDIERDLCSGAILKDGSSAGSLKIENGAYARLDNSESYQGTTKTHAGTIIVSGSNENAGPSQVDLLNGSTADLLMIEKSAYAFLAYDARAKEIDVISLGYVQLGAFEMVKDEATQEEKLIFVEGSGASAGTIDVGGHKFFYEDGEIPDCKVSIADINGSNVTNLIIGTKKEDGTWNLANGYVQNGSSVTNLTVQGSDNGFYSYASISGKGTNITKLLEVTDGAYAVLEDDADAKTINVSDAGSEVDMYGSTAGLLTIENSAYAFLAYAAHAETINVNSLGYVQLGAFEKVKDEATQEEKLIFVEGSGASAGTIDVGGHEFFYEDGEIPDCKVSIADINGSNVTNLTIGTENDDLANGYVKNSTIGSLIVQGSTPSDNGNYYLSYGSIDNTTIQKITIKEGALVEWFGEDSKINESGSVTIINKDDNKGTYLVTGVETIVNAGTIDLDGKKATLWFTDIENPSHDWGTDNGIAAPDADQYIGTADPDTQKVTFLHYDNISEYIKTAAGKDHNHVINGELKGNGTLAIVFGAETSAALLVRGKASEFQGTAEVYRGALVVDGTTVGKENTGTVNVYRDARYLDKQTNKWYSGGTLAFSTALEIDTNTITVPEIHTDTIDFTCRKEFTVKDENGEPVKDESGKEITIPSTGSLLYFDTQNVGNGGTLATIDANTIKLDYDSNLDGKILDENGNESMENTQIWYDGAYNLAGKDLKIELGEKTQFENASGSMSDENVEGFFSTQLIKAERDKNVINLDVQTFTEYAADKDWGGTFNNSAENAEKLINELLDTGGEYYKLVDAIYNENNEEKVKQTISNLGHNNGLVNILGVGNNLGMVGSSFFGGGLSSMGGVTQRGQEEQAENPVSADPLPTKEEDPNKWTAWASYSHSSINASSYQDGGTIDGYDVRRTGILTGLRKTLSDTFSMGVLFAYSAPELNQSGAFNSYEWKQEKDGKTFTSQVIQNSYHSNIEMDDFQFALHFEKMLGRNWQLSAFLGGGAQTLDWNRKMCVDQQLYEFTGDTTGNTLTATIYLIKNLQLTKNFSLMPTVGLDSEHSWLWGFREEVPEEGKGIEDLGMNLTNILATDQSYRRMTYSRQTFRIGTTATLTSPSNIYGFSGRIFYGRQISDKESATLEYTNDFLDNKSYFSVDGHKMGRDSWNLGFGGYMYLNTAKTLTIKADYNTIMYRNSSTQNVTAGLQWRF